MKKLSIKEIVAFREKSAKSKKTFVATLKLDKKEIKPDGGGDYWVSCLSAISTGFKRNDIQPIADRREELVEKYRATDYKRTKIMYQRNIDILATYVNFDFKKWRPSKKVNFLKKHKDNFTLQIKGLEIQVTPHHVFTIEKGETVEIGAIWFIAKLDGLKKEELGMFTDILYRYLKAHHSKDGVINPKYCIAVDIFKNKEVSYEEIEKRDVLPILNSTLDEIKN